MPAAGGVRESDHCGVRSAARPAPYHLWMGTAGEPTRGGTGVTLDADPGTRDEGGAPEVPVRGALVGRYVVLSHLGRGAMGIVVAAYDPELDRRIALKLLRPQPRRGSTARARLQREALALARLNHPNVVAVHDVGVHAGRVFIAMELVAGRTLRQWMSRPRSWQEVLPVFEAAARGLASAHRAGLVHRDFKPENVMIGDDGRVRVMDFGLARPGESDSARDSEPTPTESGPADVLSGSLTRTGAILGTPAYMAPEQFAGGVAGAHSDQFSVCVSLFEALYGMRPFEGETAGELACSVTQGQPRRVTGERRVPTWVHRTVLRGLSHRVADRFPSMEALASALTAGEARGRRRRRSAVVLGVGMAVAMGLGWQRWEDARLVEQCHRAGDALDPVWNASRRAAVAQGIERSELPYASRVAEEVLPAVDDYAQRWRETATRACTARTIDRTWSASHEDKAAWCLDVHLTHVDALAEALERSTPVAVRRAITSVAAWAPPEECANTSHLELAADPPPRERRDQVHALLEELARIDQRLERDDAEGASPMIERAVKRAEELDWTPLRIRALLEQSHAASLSTRFEEAERAATDAYMLASASDAWRLASTAANVLVYTIGQDPERLGEARTWARHARVADTNGGFEEPHNRARIDDNLGMALLLAGKLDEARDHFQRALSLTVSDLGPDSPLTHWARFHLAQAHFAEGDFGSAKQYYEDALSVIVGSHGPDHPTVARMLAGIGEASLRQGEPEEAERRLQAAVQIWRRAGLADDPSRARALIMLGATQRELGKLEPARETLDDSIRTYERLRGPRHPDVTHPMTQLASVWQDLGDLERATELLERALAIRLESLGPDHALVGVCRLALGKLALRKGDPDTAIDNIEDAVRLMRDGYGPRHPNTALGRAGLGLAYEARGDLQRAAAETGRALELLSESLGADHPEAARARETLDRISTTAPLDESESEGS